MKEIKLFICHSFFESEGYYKVLDILNACPVPIINYSCTRNEFICGSMTQKTIEDQLIKRISLCDVLVIILGKYFIDSTWMKFEIEQARKRDIPVLAVIPDTYHPTVSVQSYFSNMISLGKDIVPAILSLVKQD